MVVWSVCTSVTKSKLVGPHIQLDTLQRFTLFALAVARSRKTSVHGNSARYPLCLLVFLICRDLLGSVSQWLMKALEQCLSLLWVVYIRAVPPNLCTLSTMITWPMYVRFVSQTLCVLQYPAVALLSLWKWRVWLKRLCLENLSLSLCSLFHSPNNYC